MHLLLADSEVGSLRWIGHDLALRLSAAHVVTPPAATAAGAGTDTGYRTGVWLVLGAAHVVHETGPVLGRITEGQVRHAAQRLQPLTLPGEWRGEILLTLEGAHRFALTVAARSLHITLDAGGQWQTSYAC